MLYLTGATSSVKKSENVPQTDVSKSLGGYISSSPVPNNALNALFDAISLKTIKDRQKETICIGLVNGFSQNVKNVSLKIISGKDDVCRFKIAATMADKNLTVEHIPNRYSEPINAEFYDATFNRASVDVEIVKDGVSGETLSFAPFDIIADLEEGGIEGTWNAINKAFSKSEIYSIGRLSKTRFRIERKDEKEVSEPLSCSVLATENCELKFLGEFENKKANEVLIAEELKTGGGIGLWIQREVVNYIERTNEELIEDYDAKRKVETTESVEIVISYDFETV